MNTGKDLVKHHYLIKKLFYSELNLEGVNDEDYINAKIVFEELKTKNLDEYHDLYVQSDPLLGDVFEDIRNKCIEIYELDPAHFLPATILA